jgi:DNA polymerase-1
MFENIRYNFKDAKFVFTFDKCKSKYRKELYPEYKATRKSSLTEDELVDFRDTLDAFIEIVECAGYITMYGADFEADDFIACLTKMVQINSSVTIISTDKDLLQLINENVNVYEPVKSYFIKEENFTQITEIPLPLFLTYRAIVGDSSDNIGGIPSVGEKTAKKLISDFGTWQNMCNEIAKKEKPSAREKALLDNKHIFERNMKLMDLRITAKDDFLRFVVRQKVIEKKLDREKLLELLSEYEATSHMEKILNRRNV